MFQTAANIIDEPINAVRKTEEEMRKIREVLPRKRQKSHHYLAKYIELIENEPEKIQIK